MKSHGKLILSVVVALVVALGFGYAWGTSGRFSLERALDDTRQQLDLAEARGLILDARVNLYKINFGDASRSFEEAKVPLRRVRERFQQTGNREAAANIDAAIRHVEEAQRLAGALDQTANAVAGEALDAIKLATSSPSPP